jgi:(5-formylfuran-3-yl)methyl phosphate synthase
MKTKVKTNGCGLLVSVRSAEEATAAVKAGADLIDVKEPARGPLGMAEAEVVGGVLAAVGTKVPVSAALGEWTPNAMTDAVWHLELPLTYVKWGLAGYAAHPGWGEDILDTRRQVPARIQVVAVAYADHVKAKSIPPAEVAKFAKRYRYAAFLLDTYTKDGKTLLDHLSVADLTEIVQSLKRGGVKVAVGGSLKLEQLKLVLPAGPDWVAVRGGVCIGGKRTGDLDPTRVKKWKEAVAG